MKIFFIIVFLSLNVHAQWQPDFRLTYDSAYSANTNRSVASIGTYVHVVWTDDRDGNYQIYYKRSTDDGTLWSVDLRLSNNFANSENPSISVSGSAIHVVWKDDRDGNLEIYYKRSTDGGLSWESDTRLTNNFASSMGPSLSIAGSIVHLVWEDHRDGNWEIYYKRSTDGGINWGSDTRVTNNPAVTIAPSLSVSGQFIHVVWFQLSNGRNKIFYKRSTDGGSNWSADIQLTQNVTDSYNPSISVFGQIVHVVWMDTRNGFEIYYKRSTDGGTSWGADTWLTNKTLTSGLPFISVSAQTVHVVWQEYHDVPPGNWEIYYKSSTDSGLSWGTNTRLTNNPAQSQSPSLSISGSFVHVVWSDYRDGGLEIYYKRNPTGNPIGIININSEIPDKFSLSQNYPNPFNPSTKIKFSIPQSSLVAQTFLSVYDITSREVATLVNEQLMPGTYEVDWDATAYPSGVYFYRLQSGEFTQTLKMIFIK